MATLKLIADEISDALNRPFDDMFKERIKSIFRHELAAIIRQQINKHGINDHFLTSFPINLKKIDDNLFESNTLPTVVRYETDDPFTYVGSLNGRIPYIYTRKYELPHVNYMPSIQKPYHINSDADIKYPSRYFYNNNKLVVFKQSDESVDELDCLIEGVFVINPKDLENNASFNDDVEFPMPEDLIQLVKLNLLQGELSIVDSKDKIQSGNLDNN